MVYSATTHQMSNGPSLGVIVLKTYSWVAVLQVMLKGLAQIKMSCQWRSKLDNWGRGGGPIFMYSCSALVISFEIYCFYGL